MTQLEVLRARGLVTVQDRGRRGLAHLGIPPSGALDFPALALANRLVGNAEGAPGLETTLGGVSLRPDRDCTIAVTGATAPIEVGGRAAALNCALHVPGGDELHLLAPSAGARNYIAVRGGIDVAPVMGSASTDVLTGLGPPPLREGDQVPVGDRVEPWPPVGAAPVPGPASDVRVAISLGPRDDWFDPEAARTLSASTYVVAAASNRIGVRLEGPPLTRCREGELMSEGIVEGAIQVPPSGQPIVLLKDHPTTGGYPIIAVVLREEISRLAQLRPGDAVRFCVVRG